MIYEVKRGNTIIWSGLAFGSQFKRIMQEDRVEVTINTPSAISFKKGDTLVAYGQTYKLNRPENIGKKNTQIGYSYEIEFEALYYDFGKWILYTLDKNNALKEPAVYIMGDAKAILGLAIQNANRASSGWTLGVVDDTEVFQWAYSGAKLLTVIQDIADQTNLEFWFDNGGKRLNLTRRQPVTGIELAYGKGNGLYELYRSRRDNPIVTHLTILGGTQNIPNNYGFRNIQPTGGNPMVNPNFVAGMDRVEDTVVYENIYPRLIAKVTAANAPNVISSTDIDFNLNDHLLDDGTSAQIAFTSGLLNGFKFTIREDGYDHATKQVTFNIIQDDKAYPGGVPDTNLKPAVGDSFVFLNINMPSTYVTNAETRVKETGDQYFAEEGVEQFDWSAKITPKFALENNIELVLGGLVRLKADDIGFDGNIRIDSYSRDLQESYRYDFTLSNIVSINSLVRQRNQSDRLANTVSKGISSDGLSTKATYAERAGYAGTAGHAATATNAATANFASEAQHASTANHANTANTADYATTAGHANTADYALDSDKWDGRQFADYLDQPVRVNDDVRHKSVSSPTYTSGATGHGFTINADGSAEFDSVSIRKELNVVQLNVREITGTGGSFAVTNVAKIESVVYWNEYNYYECRINTDGGTIFVPFVEGDIIRCQVWDGQRLKYYTARVGAVYNSASKFDLVVIGGSGIPAAGDSVFQFGSSQPNRQGLIYMTNSDTGAPYLDVLDEVTSPDLTGKTKVRLGKLNGITDTVFGALNGYGLYSQNAYLRGNFWVTGGNAETQAGAQGKADNAQNNAINTASNDATSKANDAQSNAIAAAANDAIEKMNNAITSANQFTQNVVDAIRVGSRNLLGLSNGRREGNAYPFGNYMIYGGTSDGKEYTLVVKGYTTAGSYIGIYFNGYQVIGSIDSNDVNNIQIFHITRNNAGVGNAVDFYHFYSGDGGNSVIEWATLFEGNIKPPLDWIPAPEDQQNALEVYKTEVSQSFSVMNGEIAGKVNQTDFNALGQVVNNQGTAIIANTSAIELRATKQEFNDLTYTVGGVEARVTNAEAAITTQAGQIALTATKTEVTTAINNIQIGGRNLVRDSNIVKTSTAYGVANYILSEDIIIGQQYTMTVWGNFGGKRIGLWDGSGSAHQGEANLIAPEKYQLTFTVTDWVGFKNRFSIYQTPYGDFEYVQIWKIQIEKGNKGTDYGLSEKDFETDIQNIDKNTYDGNFERGLELWTNAGHFNATSSIPSTCSIVPDIGSNGGNVWRTQGGEGWLYSLKPIPVIKGHRYRVTLKYAFRQTATNHSFAYCGFAQYYPDGSTPSNLGLEYFVFGGSDINTNKLNQWIVRSAEWIAGDTYPTVAYIKVAMGFNYSGGNATIDCDSIIVEDVTETKALSNRLDTAEFKLQPTQIDAVVSSLDYKTGAQVAAGFQITSGGMNVFGQFHSFNGAVTFNSLDPSTQGSINTANSNASSALANAATANTAAGNAQSAADSAQGTANTAVTNAANAQSSANTANSNLSALQGSLGSLAYDNAVTLAKLDSTIVIGGYIKTTLINANEVFAQNIYATGTITATNLTVTDNSKIGSMSIDSNGFLYNNNAQGGIKIFGSGTIAAIGPQSAPATLGLPVPAWFESSSSSYDTNYGLVVGASNSFGNKNYAIAVLDGLSRLRGLSLGVEGISSSQTISKDNTVFAVVLTAGITVWLPFNPYHGQLIIIKNASPGGGQFTLQPNGKSFFALDNTSHGAFNFPRYAVRAYIFDGNNWVEIIKHG